MLSFNTDGDFTQNYKFLIGAIQPRPIGVISTLNKDGSNNIAPFSFFNGFSAKPMIVGFAPLIRTSTGEKKDTVINIEREKEFVVNFCTEENSDKINATSQELPYGEDESEFAKLIMLDSKIVKARRIQESPIHFECKLRDILCYGDQPGAGTLITGEVVKVHVDESIYDQGRIITKLFKPMGRGAGNDWFKTDQPVTKERLMKAQIQK